MKRMVVLGMTALLGFQLSACSNMSKQDMGALSGAAVGGLLGSQFGKGGGQLVGVAVGALAGGLIGGAIGKNMDDTDKLKMNSALDSNAVGQPAYWRNANSGASYQMTPTRNVTVGDNSYCREYRTTANIAGKRQQVYGTACRQPDGTWQNVGS